MHLSSAPLRRDVVFLPENIRHEHRLQEHRVENRQRVEAVDGCRYLVHWRRHTRLLRHACSVTAQPRKTAPLLRRKKSADDADHFSVLLISSFCSLALCVCVLSSKLAGVPFVTRDGSAQRALLLLLLFVDKDVEIVENSAGNATRQLNWQALLACLFVFFSADADLLWSTLPACVSAYYVCSLNLNVNTGRHVRWLVVALPSTAVCREAKSVQRRFLSSPS